MAEFGAGGPPRGLIRVEQLSSELVAVWFRATIETLREMHQPIDRTIEARLLDLDLERNRLRIYPINTYPKIDVFAQPKYNVIRAISFPYERFIDFGPVDSDEVRDILERMPRGFLQDYQFGLGLAKAYRPLIAAIESQTDCNELYLTDMGEPGVEEKRFVVPLLKFDDARAAIDRINDRANAAASKVKVANAVNWVARILGQEERPYKRGRHPMIQHFADAAASHGGMDQEQVDDLLELVKEQSIQISEQRPEALVKLKGDIELVELDILIDRFDKMLSATNHMEATWQEFFVQNPFILSFAFGYPMILIQQQAVAGGRKISGSGSKIVDFLSKNPTTNNVAIIEIKKPSSPLLQSKEYRGGVYGPSLELTGSITQILDQRYHLAREFVTLKSNSRTYDIESYAVQLCLIIGHTPQDPDQAKSFELFRNSLAGVDVITFDELLERVRLLRSFLNVG